MNGDTLSMDRAAPGRTGTVAAGVKTILCHVQTDDQVNSRLETGLSLARACGAHLSCLHVTPIEAYAAFDGFGGVFVMNEALKKLDEEEAHLRERIEQDLKSEDVSWDYSHVTGNVPTQILRYGALADLIVTGRDPHPSSLPGPMIGQLGDLLNRSLTPLFVPAAKGPPADPTGTAIIAWNGSYEAAHAVRSAVGLLKLAGRVHVLQVKEDKDEGFPGTRLLEYLSRHGIHAELKVESPRGAKGAEIAAVLLAHVAALDAAYLVLGGYSRSRVGEYLFGGVTRTLLADCDTPLFITG